MAKRQETTIDTRKLVIKLSNEGNSMSKVGQIVDLSKSTIQTIIKNFRRTKSYESLPRPGRQPKLRDSIGHKIVREETTQPRKNSVKLRNDIKGDYGINIHAVTVRRCLKKSGLHTCIAKEKPCISSAWKVKALENEFTTNEHIVKNEPLDCNEYDSYNLSEKNQNCKDKLVQEQFLTEELIIKEEPLDSNEHDSDSINDDNEEEPDINCVPMAETTVNVKSKSTKSSSNYPTKREEKEKFIAQHLKHRLCDLCQLPLKDFSDMHKHFSRTHSGHRGYFVCCKRKYFRPSHLIHHLHTHLNPDHFKCEQCGKVLSDRVSLERHIRRIHASDERVKKHSCDICGKSFTEILYVHSHKRIHTPEEKRKNFKCEKKEYLCFKCPKVYYRPNALKRHIHNVHTTGKDNKCTICEKDFKFARTLKDHMSSHTGTFLYACPWCSETFKFQPQMYIHRKKMHHKEWKEAKLQKNLGNLKQNTAISESNSVEESEKRLMK